MIIFDEKLYAQEMIKNGFKTTHKHVNELSILAKYYIAEGKDKGEVKDKLKEFCQKNIEQYNNDEWYKIINKTIDIAKTKKFITKKIVNITEYELNTINQLDKLNEKKVVFVMLVLYKFYDHKKFEINVEDIFRLAKLGLDSKTRLKILQNLTSKELIDINMNGERWVTFTDNNSKTIISISNFESFIYEYLYLIDNENYALCAVCSKAIKKTSNRKKYCNECWKNHRKEYQRNLMKNKRKRC